MSRFLQFTGGVFDACFGRRPFVLRHHLSEHALFSLPRLAELARTLPRASVEYNAGNVPTSLDPALTPGNGLSPEETVRRIQECQSWMVLKNVEQDPAYAALRDACLAQVENMLPRRMGSMFSREAFVFVSSPGAVTPYHMDPEQNFLLQIRGEKTLHVFDGKDRGVLSQQELERFHEGGHRNLAYREAMQGKAESFSLKPGMGLHVPVTAPHWVQNGPEVSVSFSITFHTPQTLRSAHVHRMNARLRRLGLRPADEGRGRWPALDTLKHFASRAGERAARLAKAPWEKLQERAGGQLPIRA
jgi:hypothetical protein